MTMKLYPDDSKIIAELRKDEDTALTQEGLDAIVVWTQTWMMALHDKKCKFMH